GIRDRTVTGVQTCALPILPSNMEIRFGSPNGFAAGFAEVCAEALTAGTATAAARRAPAASIHMERRGMHSSLRVSWLGRAGPHRSEERRVGKEGRCVWGPK